MTSIQFYFRVLKSCHCVTGTTALNPTIETKQIKPSIQTEKKETQRERGREREREKRSKRESEKNKQKRRWESIHLDSQLWCIKNN